MASVTPAERVAWVTEPNGTSSDAADAARSTPVDAGARVIGVNSRNLRTLAVDPSVFNHVAERLPRDTTTVAESGIRTAADLARLSQIGYDAFLVGERLITQADPGAALRELVGT